MVALAWQPDIVAYHFCKDGKRRIGCFGNLEELLQHFGCEADQHLILFAAEPYTVRNLRQKFETETVGIKQFAGITKKTVADVHS